MSVCAKVITKSNTFSALTKIGINERLAAQLLQSSTFQCAHVRVYVCVFEYLSSMCVMKVCVGV